MGAHQTFDHHNRLLGWRRRLERRLAGRLRGEPWQRQVAKEAVLLLLFAELAALGDAGDFALEALALTLAEGQGV